MPAPSNRAYWACQIGGWGLNACIQIYAAIALIGLPWLTATVELGALYGGGLLASHVLRNYIHRHQWHQLRVLPLLPRVALAAAIPAIPIGLAMGTMDVIKLHASEEVPRIGFFVGPVVSRSIAVVNWWALFVTWMTLYFIIVSARRRRQAELHQSELARALQGAELRLLKSQLNPHFLFNSLNSVRALIADDPARAQAAVTQLAKTLRYTLTSNQDELVTLAHEMEIVDDYLAIEALRLGERLNIERDVSADAARTRIPVMLLQTVVENAIKHGIAELPAGGALRIAANLRDGVLVLDVENPRPATPAPPGSEGIGLRNAAERLRLLFGNAARLELDLSAPGRAATRIRIPVGP